MVSIKNDIQNIPGQTRAYKPPVDAPLKTGGGVKESATLKLIRVNQLFVGQTQTAVQQDFNLQSALSAFEGLPDDVKDQLVFQGQPISELSPTQARELVSEDGYFGVGQTAGRLSEFVIQGGGTDIEKLKAGRQGVLDGFKAAEKLWGTQLPEISYQTLEKALAAIDDQINSLGGSVVDVTA